MTTAWAPPSGTVKGTLASDVASPPAPTVKSSHTSVAGEMTEPPVWLKCGPAAAPLPSTHVPVWRWAPKVVPATA
jgi:hypothetical protein